jgi:hypothetical protein
MVQLENDLYAGNNDSGNPSNLVIFSIKDKSSPRLVKIRNAVNVDWEELAEDDKFVYIGDTGNNLGTRNELTVYKVRKEDLIGKEEVEAEKIIFSFPEHEKAGFSGKHNFDCEAMIGLGDSLYLFTKNRGNLKTDSYSIPKTPGNYTARHIGTFDSGGLVTGADFRESGKSGELVIIGYTDKEKGYHPFVLYFPEVQGTDFFGGPSTRIDFKGKLQTESVLFYDPHKVYITNEDHKGEPGFVYQLDLKK